MKTAALIVGILAVILYFVGYLQKKRTHIILINASSRVLYIIQYIMLGAFEGAVLDVAGIISSLLAQKKELKFIKKHTKLVFVAVNLLIIGLGMLTYENIYSLLPIAGVMLHTSAFWIDNEKNIRRVSFLGSPFWLAYNFISGAYGSCIGDILSMVSIGISIYRYDVRAPKNEQK